MIDVSELMTDPDFVQAYQIRREGTGTFANEGEFTAAAPSTLDRLGVVLPSSPEDKVRFLAEGERSNNAVNVYDLAEIIMSDGDAVLSDIILWNGNTYRVANRKRWGDNGYWFAIATQFTEAAP